MSDIEMGSTTSIQPQAQASPQNQDSLSTPPTEARIKFEFNKFEDGARRSSSPSLASTMAGPSRDDQPSGEDLQAIPKSKLVESGSDYALIFNELQIKPEHHDEVVTGIIRPIRAKRTRNLKTATTAMIKDLSQTFIRGYGNILYNKQPDKWLVDESQLRKAGKERLQFTLGDYGIDGLNAHFYAILEPMWWIMRGIVFELKHPSKKRGQPKKNVEVDDSDVWQGDVDTEMEGVPHKEKGIAPRGRGRPPKAATQAAKAAKAPKIRFEQKQEKALDRIEQEIDLSKQNGTWDSKYRMTADETDEAVQEVIARLHEIRCKSDPKAFARSWDTNLARLDEIETIDELKIQKPAKPEPEHEIRDESLATLVPDLEESAISKKAKLSSPTPSKTATISSPAPTISSKPPTEQPPPRALSVANLANEPFNTNGPPSILNQLAIGQTPLIPSSISVYITTHPPLNPYENNAYHWPSAPIGIADCKRLFDGIDQRVSVINIRGYAISYGWDDVMRAVESTDQGKRYSFSVLLQDIAEAARKGVTKWRLKVLVAGVAPAYQSRV